MSEYLDSRCTIEKENNARVKALGSSDIFLPISLTKAVLPAPLAPVTNTPEAAESFDPFDDEAEVEAESCRETRELIT